MELELTKTQIIETFNALTVLQDIKGTKFSYFVLKNLAILDKEMKKLEVEVKPSEKYLEWDKKRSELCKTFSQKDSEGNPVVQNKRYVIANKETFDKELDKLKFGYNTIIKEHETRVNEFQKNLSRSKVELSLHGLASENLPDELTANQLKVVELFLTTNDSPMPVPELVN